MGSYEYRLLFCRTKGNHKRRIKKRIKNKEDLNQGPEREIMKS
jgi:hypothetical protein